MGTQRRGRPRLAAVPLEDSDQTLQVDRTGTQGAENAPGTEDKPGQGAQWDCVADALEGETSNLTVSIRSNERVTCHEDNTAHQAGDESLFEDLKS